MTGIKLTERQRELFHKDKHTLVDIITVLEHKLAKAVEDIKFIENEMLLIEEATKLRANVPSNGKHNDVLIADIEKQLDEAWEGNISAQNFVDTVTKIFTGDYYDKSN